MLPPETLDRCEIWSINEAPLGIWILARASSPAAPKSAARLPPPERATPRSTSRLGTAVWHDAPASARFTGM